MHLDFTIVYQTTAAGRVRTDYVLVNPKLYLLLAAKATAYRLPLIGTWDKTQPLPHSYCICANNTLWHVLSRYNGKGDLVNVHKRAARCGSTVLPMYDPQVTYKGDDIVMFDNRVYYCVHSTTGTFNPEHWTIAPNGLKIQSIQHYGHETTVGEIRHNSAILMRIGETNFSHRPIELGSTTVPTPIVESVSVTAQSQPSTAVESPEFILMV